MALRFTPLLIGASLAVVGCAPVGQAPGPFAGANGTAAASDITRAGNSTGAEVLATGAPGGAMARATIAIIAKHQATQRQRAVAIQRAHAAVARLSAPPKHATAGAKPKQLPRYIAVETVRDEHTAPQAQKAVVIWDTQSQDIVGNNVYDIANAPAVGATSRFETYSAEYVGAGL